MQINIKTPTQQNLQPLNKMENEIRPPDEPVRERLIQNNYYENYETETEEDQLRRILEESESEYELQLAITESNRIEKEREERTKHFAVFKTKIAQFMRIDSINRSVYSEILDYIDKYESGELTEVRVNTELYLKFRSIIDNMRLKTEDKMRILELFIREKDRIDTK